MAFLQRDFVPGPLETKRLRQLAYSTAQATQEVDERIRILEQELEALKERKLSLQSKAEWATDLLAPIRRVPPEILGEIFTHASYIQDTTYYQRFYDFPVQDIDSNVSPLVLLRVCRRWNRIALQTPSLFTQLILSGRSSVDPQKIIPLWLERSGCLPLEVYLHHDCWPWKLGGKASSFKTTLGLLGANMHRIKVLGVSRTQLLLSALFPQGTTTEAPILRKLHLSTYSGTASWWTHYEGKLNAPNLEEFTNDGWGLRLHEFVSFTPNLRKLYGHRVYGPPELRELFAQNTSIQKCRLFYGEDESSFTSLNDQPHSPIVLPQLEYMIFICNGHRRHLSRALMTINPQVLTTLELSSTLESAAPGSQSAAKDVLHSFQTWISETKPPLRRLLLKSMPIPEVQLRRLLEATPLLSQLCFEDSPMDKGAVSVLDRENPNQMDLCPLLEELVIPSDERKPILEAVFQMIRSRVKYLEETGDERVLRRLKKVTFSDRYILTPVEHTALGGAVTCLMDDYPDLAVSIQ